MGGWGGGSNLCPSFLPPLAAHPIGLGSGVCEQVHEERAVQKKNGSFLLVMEPLVFWVAVDFVFWNPGQAVGGRDEISYLPLGSPMQAYELCG